MANTWPKKIFFYWLTNYKDNPEPKEVERGQRGDEFTTNFSKTIKRCLCLLQKYVESVLVSEILANIPFLKIFAYQFKIPFVGPVIYC